MIVARRGAHLAAERSPSVARADGARRSVALPNGEGVASGSATQNCFNFYSSGFLIKQNSLSSIFRLILPSSLYLIIYFTRT